MRGYVRFGSVEHHGGDMMPFAIPQIRDSDSVAASARADAKMSDFPAEITRVDRELPGATGLAQRAPARQRIAVALGPVGRNLDPQRHRAGAAAADPGVIRFQIRRLAVEVNPAAENPGNAIR